MTKRPPPSVPELSDPGPDLDLAGVLERIEREEAPERLLTLARELEERLAQRRQQRNPH